MFEFFIAKKYIRTKNKLNFISIISILSTLGITIGVAALIIVISVFNGFTDLAKEMTIDSQAHMRIISKSEKANDEIDIINQYLSQDKMISSFSPYLKGKIILTNKESFQIIDIKGLESEKVNNFSGNENKLFSDNINLSNESNISEIEISWTNALKLSARVGDTLTATSLKSIENIITNFLVIPNTQQFVVSNIYRPKGKGIEEFVAYSNLNATKRLLGTTSISGFEIMLIDYLNAESVKDALALKINPDNFSIQTWADMNREYFNVMELERWGAFILLLLIISVATFNILGSLTMSVIEKRRDIGILRSMGASKNSILKIFMFEGILIGIIGTISGFLLGIFIAYLQNEFKLYSLDPKLFMIDAIPIKLKNSDLIIIPLASMFLSFLASLYPAKRAVKLNVIETIKYE